MTPSLDRAQEAILESEGRPGNVWLTCVPRDAHIHLDGVLQGTCAAFEDAGRGLTVKGPSLHRLEVKYPGHQTYVTYIAPGGARTSMKVLLVPLAPEEKAP